MSVPWARPLTQCQTAQCRQCQRRIHAAQVVWYHPSDAKQVRCGQPFVLQHASRQAADRGRETFCSRRCAVQWQTANHGRAWMRARRTWERSYG